MDHGRFADPALHVALALAAGILSQSLAHHLRLPGIVVLLGAGVLLGPDVSGIVRPDLIGPALHTLVGFAVAVILFEGGLNLDLRRLRRQARVIRQLATVGALITLAGGMLAARWILGWDWVPAFLFGALVIVTGPTVITPLMRRIRVQRRVATVLEAEGVLVDAIGAIFVAVALQVVASPETGRAIAFATWDLASRLLFGTAAGAAGGILIAQLLRFPRLIPEGMENVFSLSVLFALFQASNAVFSESGIVTAAVAGIVVGNVRSQALSELRDFKEQLTVLLIGMLFILLAADVRLEHVRALGWAGILTGAALALVVRPLNIVAGTHGSSLSRREKLFLSWVAPRGIVAAAGASLVADTLTRAGMPIGNELRAMVFLVIAVTVLVQGLTAGLVASFLGLRLPAHNGYLVLGANALARAFARVLQHAGEEVVLLESNPAAVGEAQAEGLRVLHGDGLRDSLLVRAEVDRRAGCLALTANEAINLLFARRVLDFKVPAIWVALRRGHTNVTPLMVQDIGAHILFSEPRIVDLWMTRLDRGVAPVEIWRRGRGDPDPQEMVELRAHHKALLPLAVRRGGTVQPLDETTLFRRGDELYAAIFTERRSQATEWLQARGWEPQEILGPPQPASGMIAAEPVAATTEGIA